MTRTNKLIFSALLLQLLVLPLSAQELAVESFRLLERDLTANLEGTKRIDPNTRTPAALIKVVTSETNFFFDGGLLGLVGDCEQKVGEIWVYVPPRAKQITIQHQLLGVLRNYYYPVPIESGRTYEMRLITGRVHQIVEEASTDQWFVMNVSPADAEVTIDGNPVAVENGSLSVLLGAGTHEYLVQAPLYETEMGRITISDKKETLTIRLKPNYGILQVNSTPQGAEVTIDGDYRSGGTTPFTTHRLSKGKHKLQFRLSSYKTHTAEVEVVGDGTTQPYTAAMQPNFAEVSITVNGEADIYINDVRRGAGSWSGRLDAGHYRVEARKESHATTTRSIDVKAGEAQSITLEAPRPRYGSLNINSHPIGATVYIDGVERGTTPDIFNKVLIGTREIRLEKPGYKSLSFTTAIDERKTQVIDRSMTSDGTISATSKKTEKAKNNPKSKANKPREKVPTKTFVLAELGYNTNQLSYGLMLGMARRAGGYVKFCSNFSFIETDYECEDDGKIDLNGVSGEPFYKERIKHKSHISITGGYLQRLCKPLYLYVGAGYGNRVMAWETIENKIVKNIDHSYTGVSAEMGFIGRIGMFAFSAGCHTIAFKYADFSIGVGVNF